MKQKLIHLARVIINQDKYSAKAALRKIHLGAAQ